MSIFVEVKQSETSMSSLARMVSGTVDNLDTSRQCSNDYAGFLYVTRVIFNRKAQRSSYSSCKYMCWKLELRSNNRMAPIQFCIGYMRVINCITYLKNKSLQLVSSRKMLACYVAIWNSLPT